MMKTKTSKKAIKPVSGNSKREKDSYSHSVPVSHYYMLFLVLGLTFPVGMVLRLIYARFLDTSQIGSIYALIGFFSLLTLFTNFGFSSSLQYFIPKFMAKKDLNRASIIVWYAILFQIGLLLIAVSLLVLFNNYFIVTYFGGAVPKMLFFSFLAFFVANNLSITFMDIFVAYNRVLQSHVIYLFQMLLLTLASVFTIWLLPRESYFTLLALLWVFVIIIAFFVYFIFVLRFAPELFKKPVFDGLLLREFLSNSAASFFGHMSFGIMTKIDVVMITSLISVSAVAHYTNVVTIFESLVTLFAIFATVHIPLASYWYSSGNIKALKNLLDFVYGIFMYLLAPVALTLGLFSEQILILLYGQAYSIDAGLLTLFSVFLLFRILMQYNISYIIGLGKFKQMYILVAPGVLINVILNVVLIKSMGIYGVAIGTILGWFIILVSSIYVLRKVVPFSISLLRLGKIVLLLGLFSGIVQLFRKLSLWGNYYIDGGFSLAIAFALYLYIGNYIGVFTFRELQIFIPTSLKPQVKNFYDTYLYFIK